jgi:uncharacterized protein (TIGR02001 family)
MTPAGRNRALALVSIASLTLVTLAAGPASGQPAPDKLRASVSLASAYLHNGLRQTADHLSLRLALDYELASGLFAGGTLANVDYDIEASFTKPRDSEVLLYAGFVWRNPDWTASVALSRYLYPDIQRNYDYSQLAVGVSFRDRYFFSAARVGEVLAVYDDAYVYRAGIAVPWIRDLEFEVNAGRFRSEAAAGVAYSFWDAGLSRPFGRLSVDLRYHDNGYGVSSLLGNRSQDLWVLSLTHALLPRGHSGG